MKCCIKSSSLIIREKDGKLDFFQLELHWLRVFSAPLLGNWFKLLSITATRDFQNSSLSPLLVESNIPTDQLVSLESFYFRLLTVQNGRPLDWIELGAASASVLKGLSYHTDQRPLHHCYKMRLKASIRRTSQVKRRRKTKLRLAVPSCHGR